MPAHAVDHIRPKSQGGTDDIENLRAICKACHQAKTQEESNRKKSKGGGSKVHSREKFDREPISVFRNGKKQVGGVKHPRGVTQYE